MNYKFSYGLIRYVLRKRRHEIYLLTEGLSKKNPINSNRVKLIFKLW